MSAARVFLDANILFSAVRSDGAVRQLLRLLRESGCVLVANGFVVEEASRNLARKERPELLADLDRLLAVVELASIVPAHAPDEHLRWLAEKDRPVLEAAIRSACAFLITGDKAHFGVAYGQTFGGVTVLSPAMAAQRLLG